MDSTRCWKHLSWHDYITWFLQAFSDTLSRCKTPAVPNPEDVLRDSDLVTEEIAATFMNPDWDDFCFATRLYVVVSTTAWAFWSWLTDVEPDMVFYCCSQSASRFVCSGRLFCSPQLHRVVIWASVAFRSAQTGLAILHWPHINKACPSTELLLIGLISLLHHPEFPGHLCVHVCA